MIRVGRAPSLAGRKHQVVAAQKRVEAIAPWHKIPSKEKYEHQPKFTAAYSRIRLANLTDGFQQNCMLVHLSLCVSLKLVIGLTTMAKQTASQRNLELALTDQFRYYLAPDFFLRGIL